MELKPFWTSRYATPATLLIVPYGIETTEYRLNMTGDHTFNRTLWN